ncbi:MAG: hypothetical protein KDK65_01015 [Chlamydiia bacterium]|nr:hypothetical protein [Chlamydiia bacterium]
MKSLFLALLIFTGQVLAHNQFDFNYYQADYIHGVKKLHIPGYPRAFNPSIISYGDHYLLAFRDLATPGRPYNAIGVVLLDREFHLVGQPQLIDMKSPLGREVCHAEDPRLIRVGEKIMLLYTEYWRKQGLQHNEMRLTELTVQNGKFCIDPPKRLRAPYPFHHLPMQKNWVPFTFQDNLLFAYSIRPHRILLYPSHADRCHQLMKTTSHFHWDFGKLRGGTPAQCVGDNYLAFFHSCSRGASPYSDQQEMLHYFIGAYTFSGSPPFEIQKISPKPIASYGMYHTPSFEDKVVVFPGGYVTDEESLYLVFGQNDEAIMVVKMDKEQLLNSLIPVDSDTH